MIKEIDLYEDDLSEHDSNMLKHFIELVCFNCQLFQRLMLQLVYIIKILMLNYFIMHGHMYHHMIPQKLAYTCSINFTYKALQVTTYFTLSRWLSRYFLISSCFILSKQFFLSNLTFTQISHLANRFSYMNI